MDNTRNCKEQIMKTNMALIWKLKLNELQVIIDNTEVCKDGRLMQLYGKKHQLETALLRCM